MSVKHYGKWNGIELSNKEWNNDISKHNKLYYSLQDSETLTQADIINLENEGFSFSIKVINETPWKMDGYVLIDLLIQYINKPLSIYLKTI